MQTKSFLIFVTAYIATVSATDDPSIDSSKAIPVQDIPGFWNNRLIKPSSDFHHKFDRNGRIVGGNEASPNAHPYQCGLLLVIHWWTGLCGGVLVSNRVVLTAAHCLEDASSVQIVFGAHNIFTVNEPTQYRRTVSAARFIIHADYNSQMLFNDIAMISLENPVILTKNIQPIRLPSKASLNDMFVGKIATVSGWGRTSDTSGATSTVLRYTRNEIKSNKACEAIFGEFVVDGTLCCITRDTNSGICNGDSGGPLTLQENGELILVGIVSYGALAGCERNYPTGFVRVTYFMEWIENHIRKIHDS